MKLLQIGSNSGQAPLDTIELVKLNWQTVDFSESQKTNTDPPD